MFQKPQMTYKMLEKDAVNVWSIASKSGTKIYAIQKHDATQNTLGL